jgi:hypothetical protein
MIHYSRFAVSLAATTALLACKAKTETAEPPAVASESDPPAATQGAETAAPEVALLDACKIKMTQPEAHEWETKWDPAHTRTVSQNPSGVRSGHWANEAEQKIQRDSKSAIPLDVGCGSDDRVEPTINLHIAAFDSAVADVPLAPGTYRIAPKASPAKNKPGEFIVNLFFNKNMFEAKSGTLTIDRFDMNGAAGSFVIDGNEILTGSRPLHLEGSFDMPCRQAILESACQSNKAQQPR